MKKTVLLVALLGFVLLLSPVRSEKSLQIGVLTNGVLTWSGSNPYSRKDGDEFVGFRLGTQQASGSASITINGSNQKVDLSNTIRVTQKDGQKRLWISGNQLTRETRDLLRTAKNLSIKIRLEPAPTNLVSVEFLYNQRRYFFQKVPSRQPLTNGL